MSTKIPYVHSSLYMRHLGSYVCAYEMEVNNVGAHWSARPLDIAALYWSVSK